MTEQELQTLKEHFEYHPDGYLVRKKVTGSKTFIGQVVRGYERPELFRWKPGVRDVPGYRKVKIPYGRAEYLHRIVFALNHGRVPSVVDHINGDRSDNRVENLREVTTSENNHNRQANRVYFRRDRNVWFGRVIVNGKRFYIPQNQSKKIVEKKLTLLLEAL